MFIKNKQRSAVTTKNQKIAHKNQTSKGAMHAVFFSDEKIFSKDQMFNRQIDRWIDLRLQYVPRVMQTKFPATVMLFRAFSTEGDVMPSTS